MSKSDIARLSQWIRDHVYQLIFILLLALVIIQPQENPYQPHIWRGVRARDLKETKYLFVLSCSVPRTVVGIGNIVMNRADMFPVSMELRIYLWGSHRIGHKGKQL